MKFHGQIVCTARIAGPRGSILIFSVMRSLWRQRERKRKRGRERAYYIAHRRSDGNNAKSKTEINFSQYFVAFRKTAVKSWFFSSGCDSLNASVLPYHMCINFRTRFFTKRGCCGCCLSFSVFWKQRDATQRNAMRRNATW